VPQVFDLWQDPQERYDIFMNNYTERTWTLVTISEASTAGPLYSHRSRNKKSGLHTCSASALHRGGSFRATQS
jgi:hypothetical protein